MAGLNRRFVSAATAPTFLFLLMSGSARAAGTVTNCSYAGPGGLAAALTSGGLVTFACSGTLIVPQISITASTNVVGTGQSVTLSGNLANGVFNVSAGVTLALTNLTIANGTSASGAGVNNAGTLTVTNCTFSGNLANSQGGVGGGIFNTGTATVTNSTFSGNAAEFGGGIYTDSSLALTVTNSTFSDNTSSAVGRNAGNGGAIDNNGLTFVINSTFSGNHAAVGGGAIENESAGEVEIFNATFWGNSALAGGGIEDDAADLGDQMAPCCSTARFWKVKHRAGTAQALSATTVTTSRTMARANWAAPASLNWTTV